MMNIPFVKNPPDTLHIKYKDGYDLKVPHFDMNGTKLFLAMEIEDGEVEDYEFVRYTGE